MFAIAVLTVIVALSVTALAQQVVARRKSRRIEERRTRNLSKALESSYVWSEAHTTAAR